MRMKKRSAATILVSSLVGLMAGAGQVFYISFFPACVLGTVLAALFFAWGGWLPAALYLAASVGGVGWLFGAGAAAGTGWAFNTGMAGATALLVAAPAAVVIAMLQRRASFAARLKGAVGAQLAAFLILICVLYFQVQRDLISVLVEYVNGWIESLPASLRLVLAQQFAFNGLITGDTAQKAIDGSLRTMEVLGALKKCIEVQGNLMRLRLPGLLFSSGLLTGVLAVALPDCVIARRGDEIDYVPFCDWHMPRQVTIGAMVCLAATGVLLLFKVSGAEAVWNALIIAGGTLCVVIGASALDRRMKAGGRGKAFRVILIGLGVVFAQWLIMICGAYSALLGSQGLISGYIRRKKDEHDGEE